uniref:Lysophospholipid acyltransferase 5 n=1 Tax=Macrostomum lignano TaxID=282301 RepID=A0A1I8FUU1_9PLAT
MEFLADEGYASYLLLGKWLYLMVACFVLRQKYYFAWSLGELGYLCSGFGFSGIEKISRKPEYKLAQNFEFFHAEFGTSLKLCIDFWNISTVNWLRECIYERVPGKHATLAVFFASAARHGFYPGYYLMFISLAGFTQVARMARRVVRPHFQQSEPLRKAYDIATGVAAMTTLNCCAGAFALLELSKSWAFWRSVYFLPHLVALVFYTAFTFKASKRSSIQSQVAHAVPQNN